MKMMRLKMTFQDLRVVRLMSSASQLFDHSPEYEMATHRRSKARTRQNLHTCLCYRTVTMKSRP
jgi:hypothetical protein